MNSLLENCTKQTIVAIRDLKKKQSDLTKKKKIKHKSEAKKVHLNLMTIFQYLLNAYFSQMNPKIQPTIPFYFILTLLLFFYSFVILS